MKRCPQCNALYEDTTQFCLRDGKPLVEESFSLPSDEEETIIRHDPITINIPAPDEYTAPASQSFQPAENVVVVPSNQASTNRNYALFLIIGLLIGGGLVLVTLLLAKNYFQSPETNVARTAENSNQTANVTKPKATPEAATTNINSIVNAANVNSNANAVAAETPSPKHAEPNDDANDGMFNGRVIVANARVRSDPNPNASITDVLPIGDRLDIIDRAKPNSPWYLVECEHGVTGWMHGDTIEFTKGNF